MADILNYLPQTQYHITLIIITSGWPTLTDKATHCQSYFSYLLTSKPHKSH